MNGRARSSPCFPKFTETHSKVHGNGMANCHWHLAHSLTQPSTHRKENTALRASVKPETIHVIPNAVDNDIFVPDFDKAPDRSKGELLNRSAHKRLMAITFDFVWIPTSGSGKRISNQIANQIFKLIANSFDLHSYHRRSQSSGLPQRHRSTGQDHTHNLPAISERRVHNRWRWSEACNAERGGSAEQIAGSCAITRRR